MASSSIHVIPSLHSAPLLSMNVPGPALKNLYWKEVAWVRFWPWPIPLPRHGWTHGEIRFGEFELSFVCLIGTTEI